MLTSLERTFNLISCAILLLRPNFIQQLGKSDTKTELYISCSQRVRTLWLTTSIPGVAIRVPVGFLLPPVVVIRTAPIVSVIVISSVWKDRVQFTLELNSTTLNQNCFGCQQSPERRVPWVTPEVLVSAL